MNITIIGFMAGTITTIGFFPQVIKALKTKNTTDVAIFMPIFLSIGIFLWFIYGILINDWPVIIANVISLIANVWLIILKIRYSQK